MDLTLLSSVLKLSSSSSLSLSLFLSHSILAGQIKKKKIVVKIRSYFDDDSNWVFSR